VARARHEACRHRARAAGELMCATNRAKTHCLRGHELSGENLVRSQLENAGIRNCRTCWNENARARRRRNSTLRVCPKCRGGLVRRPGGWKICLKCTQLRKKAAEMIAAGTMPSLDAVLKAVADIRAEYPPLIRASRQKSLIEPGEEQQKVDEPRPIERVH
jgi:hypothetical protein